MKKELSNRRSNSPDPLDSIDMAQRSLDASSLFMETQLLVLGRVDGVAESAQGKGTTKRRCSGVWRDEELAHARMSLSLFLCYARVKSSCNEFISQAT